MVPRPADEAYVPTYRALVCADERLGWSREHLPDDGSGWEWVGPVVSGSEAMACLSQQPLDVVVIAGDIDGCDGSRVAAAVARRSGATVVLLSSPQSEGELQDELMSRGVAQRVSVVPLLHPRSSAREALEPLRTRLFMSTPRGSSLGRPRVLPAVRPEVLAIAESGIDATMLVGSAGTPQLMPDLLGPRTETEASLTVAVHHNPRWSDGFVEWVNELAGFPAAGQLDVVPAAAVDGGTCLSPNLGKIIRDALGRGDRTLVCIASGMTEEGLEALSKARTRGAAVVVLDPALCPQPAMVEMAIGAGWADAVVSIDELAWLIAHAGTPATRLAMTG